MAKKGRMESNSGKLTGTREEPVEVGDEGRDVIIRQESIGDDEKSNMEGIPAEESADSRKRRDESEEGLFISEGSEDEGFQAQKEPPSRRKNPQSVPDEAGTVEDDKKKMAMNTTYDGFSIYGRILCLVVKRRGTSKGKQLVGGAGQAMMEEWITSTQLRENQMMDE